MAIRGIPGVPSKRSASYLARAVDDLAVVALLGDDPRRRPQLLQTGPDAALVRGDEGA